MKNSLIICLALLFSFSIPAPAQKVPVNTLVKISKAEDERRFDKTLEDLLKDKNAAVRARAALAAGRIGDERAIPELGKILIGLGDPQVTEMAAFALGEIESIKGADAVLTALKDVKTHYKTVGRAVGAAGKIAAANPKEEKSKELGEAILDRLEYEAGRASKQQDKDIILLGITAVLRARPEEGAEVVAKFLTNLDARIRADAANTLARLRAKNANEKLRAMLLTDDDPVARANAARALGAAEDKDSLDLLITAATTDPDLRVRVNAIRSLGGLKDAKAAGKLLESGEKLLTAYRKSKFANPVEKNELLEIASALGRILPNSDDEKALKLLNEFNLSDGFQSPEISVALVRIKKDSFLDKRFIDNFSKMPQESKWKALSGHFQGVGEIPDSISPDSKNPKDRQRLDLYLSSLVGISKIFDQKDSDFNKAIPDLLNAYAKFKPDDLSQVLRQHLEQKDLFIRTTAAGLLGDQPASKENVEALKTAFASALKTDKDYDDAQLAILSALVKLDKQESVESLKLALDAPDYLVRRQAADLIKQNDLVKDFPDLEKQVGPVKPYDPKTGTKLGQILNSEADYRRAVSRRNGTVRAVLTTEKGDLTIELLPEDAPLTVDNFIKLARSGYFNGVLIHRVVPNFVVQDGDPRGDGNGGPGWQIRCEINTVPYDRAAVGMALSGKDTGGSQWFVTHSPQPHLDGGYTVFGKMNESDMRIVDNLVRGDRILKVEIVEGGKK